MSDAKITNIEEILAHQEREINTLNQMVTRQWDEIDLLKKHIRKLQGAVSSVTETVESLSPAEQSKRDKPPHY